MLDFVVAVAVRRGVRRRIEYCHYFLTRRNYWLL
jgi:hypothetical protein